MNGLTALRGLELLDLPAGETLLVSGGAGLLASYVVPLATRAGLVVLADAGPADEDRARLWSRRRVAARRGSGDGCPPCRARRRRRCLRHGIARTRDPAGDRPGGGLAYLRTWNGEDIEDGITIHRVIVADVLDRSGWLLELSRLAGQGVLALRVVATFPPERAADAHRQTEVGGLRGRAVVVFD